MAQAILRFHGDLDYFLAAGTQDNVVAYAFDLSQDGNVSAKHVVEATGVPHTEIDQIRVNGQTVGFDYGLSDGDAVDVFTWVPKPDHVKLRPPLPRPVRFVADTHLGRLAAYLRLLGFDTLYRNDYNDETLATLSQEGARVLLTRDRGLLKRRIVDFGCVVREDDPKQQLIGVVQRYNLANEVEPWRRCLRCNALLEPVDKEEIIDQLEPKTKRYFSDFWRCSGCARIYWPGSHYERLQPFIDQVLELTR